MLESSTIGWSTVGIVTIWEEVFKSRKYMYIDLYINGKLHIESRLVFFTTPTIYSIGFTTRSMPTGAQCARALYVIRMLRYETMSGAMISPIYFLDGNAMKGCLLKLLNFKKHI